MLSLVCLCQLPDVCLLRIEYYLLSYISLHFNALIEVNCWLRNRHSSFLLLLTFFLHSVLCSTWVEILSLEMLSDFYLFSLLRVITQLKMLHLRCWRQRRLVFSEFTWYQRIELWRFELTCQSYGWPIEWFKWISILVLADIHALGKFSV